MAYRVECFDCKDLIDNAKMELLINVEIKSTNLLSKFASNEK